MDLLVKILLTLSLFINTSCSSLSYIFDTGINHLKILNKARPIEEVLKSPYTDSKTKWAIRKVVESKKFAVDELGLDATSNYREYTKLDREFVSWVVSAAHPIKLEARQWSFPIIGKVPYLGFYTAKKAKNYALELRKDEKVKVAGKDMSFDVWIRGVPAYSTLGWFPDPLLSTMISDSEFDIVDLVVHESLHATLWINNQVDFNESLASFVGAQAAFLYIEKKYGRKSKQYSKAVKELKSGEKFSLFIQRIIKNYKTAVEKLWPKNQEKALKEKSNFYAGLFQKFIKEFPNSKNTFLKENIKKWNNATLMSYKNYSTDTSAFHGLLKRCGGDLRKFVRFLKANYEQNEDKFGKAPYKHLKTLKCK